MVVALSFFCSLLLSASVGRGWRSCDLGSCADLELPRLRLTIQERNKELLADGLLESLLRSDAPGLEVIHDGIVERHVALLLPHCVCALCM